MRGLFPVLVCLIPALYFGIIAAYALYHHADYAADTVRLLRYVVGPLAISLAMLSVMLFLSRRSSGRFGLYTCAVLVGLFAFEGLLTANVFSAVHGMFARTALPATVDTAVSLPPSYTWKRVNDVLGVDRLDEAILANPPHTSVMLCTGEDGAPIVYEADRNGFNNPDDVYDRPVTLLLIGDSFVEGLCLAPQTDFVSRVRDRIPGTVGMGSRGTGPLYHLAILGRYGPVLRPRHTVIAFFAGNDWENLDGEEDMIWLRPALDARSAFGPLVPSETLAAAKDPLESWWAAETPSLYAILTRSDIARNFVALHQTMRALGLYYPKHHPPRPVFTEVLERARLLADSWNGDVSVAFIPVMDRYTGLLPSQFAFDQLRSRVRDAANATGVGFIDLTRTFDQDPDPLRFYAADAHFGEEGAIRAADVIADAIVPAERVTGASDVRVDREDPHVR